MPPLFVANVTPFTAAGAVDYAALRRHAGWLAAAGADGFAPAGTTGEFLYLSAAEKAGVHAAVLAGAAGRPVLPCVWDPSPREAARLAQRAADGGAAGVFLPPPLYHPVPESSIRRWYAAIRAAVGIPVLAYHHPRTHNPLSGALIAQLLGEDGLDGVKDSSGDAARVAALAAAHPGKVWVGGDEFLGAARELGDVAGHVSGIANGWPGQCGAIVRSRQGNAWAREVSAAVRIAGGSPALKAALGLGNRPPLDAVGDLAGLPPVDFDGREG